MATSSKRASATPARRTAKSTSASSGRESRPFLRFYHSAGLRKKTLLVLSRLEEAEDATVHRNDLADIVVELMNNGMDYYFMMPLKLAKPGFVIQQSANIAMAGSMQVMASVIRNIIGRMNQPQLISVCGSIRQLML